MRCGTSILGRLAVRRSYRRPHLPRTGRCTGAADVLTDERCGKWRLFWPARWHRTGLAAISPTLAGIHIHTAVTRTVSEQVAQQVDLTIWPGVLPECLDHHRAGICVPGQPSVTCSSILTQEQRFVTRTHPFRA
jgi:hypothetical protein